MTENLMFPAAILALVVAICLPAPSPADETSTPSREFLVIARALPVPPVLPGLPPQKPQSVPLSAAESSPSAQSSMDAPVIERLPFSLQFQGTTSDLATISAFVLPGSTLELAATGGSGAFVAESKGGVLAVQGVSSWKWTAPKEHGDHEIRLRDRTGGQTARLHLFVLHPYDGHERIGDYHIGQYQGVAKDGDPAYNRPVGFVEVTAKNVDTMLSPHFRLGQFVCKGSTTYPKYVAVQTALLVKLESLIDALAKRGLPARTLHVMSGYRTPAYNAGIGNETTYSRHTYGDAADVFLDRDGDGMQDDLNADGRSTREDSRILYQIVEETLEAPPAIQMAGGLAVYGPNSAHGPFLHIDTRGKKARW